MAASYFLLALILLLAMFGSVKAHKLDVPGALCGGFIGLCLYAGGGFWALGMLATFFVLGTVATSWKMNRKQQAGFAEKNKGRRRASQVFANGGAAAIAALLATVWPQWAPLFLLMMAASLSSATADTLSSEMGMVYGKKFYNIRSFKPDRCGLDGVISVEGTLLGVMGSCVIAGIYALRFGWGWPLLWIVIAGTVGNLTDSYLGATLERKNYLRNDAVNFLNTVVAAVVMLLLWLFFK